MNKINLNHLILVLLVIAAGVAKCRADADTITPVSKASAVIHLQAKPALKSPRLNLTGETVSDLQRFTTLKSKDSMTPREQREKDGLLKKDAFLRGLQKILNHTPESPHEAAMQNSALDALMEALHKGHGEVALEVLRNVVTEGALDEDFALIGAEEGPAPARAQALEPWGAFKRSRPGAEERATMIPEPVTDELWREIVPEAPLEVPKTAGLKH